MRCSLGSPFSCRDTPSPETVTWELHTYGLSALARSPQLPAGVLQAQGSASAHDDERQVSLCCACDPRALGGTTGPLNREKTGAPSQEVTRPWLHRWPEWTLRFEHRTVPESMLLLRQHVMWIAKARSPLWGLSLSSARCESELGQV